MIFGHIENTFSGQYPAPIARALAYLQKTDFIALPAGRYLDEETGYTVQILDLHTQPKSDLHPEVHRHNVDVQFLVSGTELIGVVTDNGRNPVHQEWNEARDILFYQDVDDESWLTMYAGNFAVFFPQDVHRPACIHKQPCAIRKVVVKIPMAHFHAP
ncbi:YhcH/YjgK/YiaL family protein [Pectobacterium parmentieri]|uniref:YhcH/YjgK/YiaL family protein n=1 Tax=Pectobacterium parmentieri TaxID=1905730 RepID=UPI000CDDEE63|nr:YhcH/YjgK/YiaL family protein [Pectobacterium parmentieri]AYH07277.1 YhcH/YjgK/YiaL family protein [Pectobacterium parmentieri]AYH16086.1 YhcH/YjgK/YiaL family protein [Pectobacterium parmentieri]AYH24796.1 YhcH/YjgK/YiaL family protein [Pectobacterium parmentieri]MBN3175981.1 YhcH/YjgK/YiaL family protein [Pectobacterium parmentieri]POW24527.1 toxin-antitoxin biofilm protein TabA [Pectobacterium parmentieri]